MCCNCSLVIDQFAVPGSLVHDNSKSWGLATYKESRLLVNVTEEADDTKDEALKLIAKTVAHGVSGVCYAHFNASLASDKENLIERTIQHRAHRKICLLFVC